MLAFGQPMRKIIISFNKYTYFLFTDKITTQKGMQCFFSFLTVPSHFLPFFLCIVMTYIRHPVKKLYLIS